MHPMTSEAKHTIGTVSTVSNIFHQAQIKLSQTLSIFFKKFFWSHFLLQLDINADGDVIRWKREGNKYTSNNQLIFCEFIL